MAAGNGTTQVDAARDEVALLIDVLPERMAEAFRRDVDLEALLEIVLDLGRAPEARLVDGARRLDDDLVAREDLAHVLERTGPLGGDNRAGIERTLHRISAIRNRNGEVVGLTLRVGRAVFGTVDMIRDLVESGRNLLLLGRPGVGKTTKLRELARVLADDFERRVVIVDTSNEIGGDGDVPHPGIGRARRMQVPRPSAQHDVMIEAVENHMPEAIIVDEIGTSLEAAAARTIAERGVQLVATAHGTTLENLVLNPTLSDLVGGTHTVTLSDDEARRRRTPKTITERRGVPTFDAVVEIVDRREVVCHVDTAEAVDRLLAGQPIGGERRQMVAGQMEVHTAEPAYPDGFEGEDGEVGPALATLAPLASRRDGVLRVAVLGVNHDLLRRVLDDLDLKARVMAEPDGADLMLALRDRTRERGVKLAAARGVPVYTLKKNSSAEMKRVLRSALSVVGGAEEEDVRDAVLEAEHAIARVVAEGVPVSLAPRSPSLRKVQHRLISRHHLESESAGREPFRHLVVYPPALA